MLHIHDRGRALRPTRPELSLIAITAVWGATFVIVHQALEYTGPWFFVGVRFIAAAAITSLVFHRHLRRITRRDLAAGAVIGVTIYLGYGLQTVGLQTIAPSTSAFITALYVPLVPILQLVFLRTRPSRMALLGIALAFVGLILLAGPGAFVVGLGPGELMTLIGTVAVAAEIILIGRFAGRVNLGAVTVVQLFVAGLLAFATMPIVGEAVPAFSWVWLAAGVGLGLASAAIQLTMNWAQKSVSPTRATVIYAGEPVWGGLFGVLAGDQLSISILIGAALIVAGVIVSELPPPRRRRDGATGEVAT